MDEIRIKGLEVYCNHGVFSEENKLGQKFIVNGTLYTHTRDAGQNDDLEKSIDYGTICHAIYNFMKGHTFQLIEAVAEQLALELLMTTPRLEALDIEIEKPWAPIGLPLDGVSVKIHRKWHTAYIALGSNMGDKQGYLEMAVEKLKTTMGCEVMHISPFIQTAPYGVLDQDDFLNGAVELRTLLKPEELLEELHKIEQAAGRERTQRWGPRTLDLDIIFYDDEVIDTPTLHIPHIEMHKRDFVLEPMSQISPYKRHPVYKKTVQEMLAELK